MRTVTIPNATSFNPDMMICSFAIFPMYTPRKKNNTNERTIDAYNKWISFINHNDPMMKGNTGISDPIQVAAPS